MLHRLSLRFPTCNSFSVFKQRFSEVPRGVLFVPTSRFSGTMSQIPSLKRFFTTSSDSKAPKDASYWNNLTTEEKRTHYRCGDSYQEVDSIMPWAIEQGIKRIKVKDQALLKHVPAVNAAINSKVCVWQGDITLLEADCIVNAANSSLLGGGGVDGAIHRAAGRSLFNECEKLNGCNTGDAKVSSGHRLPAKRIIHTVGPMGVYPIKLQSCYDRCLEELLKLNMRTVAFPCISTGVYGYPGEKAAHVALGTVRHFLETDDNASKVDRIIFCVFLRADLDFYYKLLPVYFPTVEAPAGGSRGDGTAAKRTKLHQDQGERAEAEAVVKTDVASSAADAEAEAEAEAMSSGDEGKEALGSESAGGDVEEAVVGGESPSLDRRCSGSEEIAARVASVLDCSEARDAPGASGAAVDADGSMPPSGEGDGRGSPDGASDIIVPSLRKAFTAPAQHSAPL